MDITTTEQIILILLAITLAVFLLLGIIILIKIRQILSHVEKITERAEYVADFVGKATPPLTVLKLIGSIVEQASKARKKKGE